MLEKMDRLNKIVLQHLKTMYDEKDLQIQYQNNHYSLSDKTG